MMRNIALAFWCGAATSFLPSCGLAAADGGDADRFPHSANAVVTINVPVILDSGFAKQQEWRSKMTKSAYDRPLAVPASATRIVTAAQIDLSNGAPRWQASLIHSSIPLNGERLAASREGYVDKAGDKKFVVTPNGTFFTQYNPGVIAAFWPAQRQVFSRWLNGQGGPAGLSPTLAAGLEVTSAPYVLTVDTSDAYSPAGILHTLENGGLPSLNKMDTDIAPLCKSLASVQQIQLCVNFATGVQGQLTITFGEDVSAIGPNARQLVQDVIAESGLNPAAIEQWSFNVSGKQIKGEGSLNLETLQDLNALFIPPAPPEQLADADPSPAKPGTTPGAAGDAANAPASSAAEASRQYFKAICKVIDHLNFQQASLSQTGAFLRAQANLIDRLPVLNVDPALQSWGSDMSGALVQSALMCYSGQTHAIAAGNEVVTPTPDVDFSYTGNQMASSAQTRADFRNAQRARVQAGTQTRSQTLTDVTVILGKAAAPRPELRKAMTNKYQAEF